MCTVVASMSETEVEIIIKGWMMDCLILKQDWGKYWVKVLE